MAISKEIWEQEREQALFEKFNQIFKPELSLIIFQEIYSHFNSDDENINSNEDEDENPMPDDLDDRYEDYIPNPDSQYEDKFENLD